MKILMVCLGNICRSPIAEGIFKNRLEKELPGIFIDSAGTGGWHEGQCPDQRSVSIAKKFGTDISSQKARKIRQDDLDTFDLIFTMDRENLKDVKSMAISREQQDKIHLLLDYAGMGMKDVPDPYYGGDRDFEDVYTLLDEASHKVAARILRENKVGKA